MIDRLEPYRHWLGDSMKASGGGWFMAKCPSHEDKHRSLAVHEDGHHHCKAGCGEKGDSYIVAQKVGLDHNLYARGNVKSDNKTASTPKISARNSSPEPPSANGGVPDVYLENKELSDTNDSTSLKSDIAKYHKHLMENFEKLPWQLSKDRVKGIELGLDHANKVVIPIRDADGEPIAMKKHKGNQWGYDTKNKWYPAERIAGYDKNKTLIVTAGEHDCEVATEYFGHQCATVTGGEGSVPSDEYWTLINGFAKYIIVYDNDSTGRSGARKIAQEILRRNPTAEVRIATWSKKCPEKWDIADSVEKELGVTFNDALDDSKLVKPKTEIGEFKLIQPNQIKDIKPAPVEWFIENKCPKNYVSLIAGETNSNKSYFAMQEGMSIATKTNFLDSKTPRRAKVLFVDTECGAESLTKRFLTLVESCGFDRDELNKNYAMISKRGSFSDAYPQISKFMKELEPDLVYIDNLYTSTDIVDISQNKNLKPILETILQLMEEHNSTLRLVHHFNKPSANRDESFGIPKIAGGAFLGNWCEHITVLCRTNQDNLRLMRVVKSRDSQYSNQVYGLEWCPDGKPKLALDGIYDNWSILLKDEGTVKHWLRILDEIAPKEGDKFDTNRWKNAVDADVLCEVTDRTAERWLREMETMGLVKNIGQQGRLRIWKRTSLKIKDWSDDKS